MDKEEKYSMEELAVFKTIIEGKIMKAKESIASIEESLSITNENLLKNKMKGAEDTIDAEEQENLNLKAVRLQRFIQNLESALTRIKNGTYGICFSTGKLISKERLVLVPHTTLCFEAKQNRGHHYFKK